MYLKSYKIHTRFMVIGLVIAFSPIALELLLNLVFQVDIVRDFSSQYQIIVIIFQVIAGLTFGVSMWKYYKIIDVFYKVKSVTECEKIVLFIAHILI